MERFDQLKNIDQKFYCSDYYDLSVNKYGVKCGTSLRFWKNMGWINEINPYRWFQWYFRYWLGRGSKDDERQINRCIKIVSSFKGKLVRMIEDTGSKCDNYSISPKTRHILLHWGYELTEKYFFNDLTNQRIKMSYYQFNRQEILQKTKERHSNKEAAEYYSQIKEAIKEKSKNRCKNLSQEEKDKIKGYQKRYQELVQYKEEAVQNKYFLLFSQYKKMTKKTLNFDNIRVNKREFHKSKQPIE